MTLLYYGDDGIAAKALAAKAKADGSTVHLREASAFDGEAEACEVVIIADDVPTWRREALAAAYPGRLSIASSDARIFDADFSTDPNEFVNIVAEPASQPVPRRGRPPGSKNKAA